MLILWITLSKIKVVENAPEGVFALFQLHESLVYISCTAALRCLRLESQGICRRLYGCHMNLHLRTICCNAIRRIPHAHF